MYCQVCQQTFDYAGCVEALSSDSRTNDATNLTTLVTICLDLALANATDIVGFVKQMAEDPSTNPDLKSVLSDCVFGYQDTVGSFRSAGHKVRSKSEVQLRVALYEVAAAIDGPESCRLELADHNLSEPPEIFKRYGYIRLFSIIGDVLLELMLHMN
ncbi:hypothetical protein CDL15_Pgr027822 [Punica granatum]|uniref:Pectinesterase inhibitor domain-containing protein n=1 Tax=Punica granatum TaxID=22663 RepID=A0A218XIK0_PUNGR|nr:hypothetical protein CDL15_Pgr027822 [Punica granatum]PKI58044.1 hypothetical protein CRG98_021537 [Punica granatum]